MSDKTISFKVEEELGEKTKALIEASGLTAKDWFQKAVATAELQSVKEGATDYASDLSELEVHTTRIFELVSNMVQKSIYLKDKAVGDLETLLEQQREITADFQMKIKIATEKKDQTLNDLEESEKNQAELQKQLNELRETLDTNKLLIGEYKEKNDTLNGLVTKYQGYAEENEQLKKTLENERRSYQSKSDDLTRQSEQMQAKIKNLEQQRAAQQDSHKNDLERLKERLEVEKEKALLQIEREHQKTLSEANNAYTAKIQALYEQISNEQKTHAEREQQLQHKIDELQKKIIINNRITDSNDLQNKKV